MKQQEEIMLSLTDLFNKMDQLRKPQMVEKFKGYSFWKSPALSSLPSLITQMSHGWQKSYMSLEEQLVKQQKTPPKTRHYNI